MKSLKLKADARRPFILAALLLCGAGAASAQQTKVIPGPTGSSYSDGRVVGNMLFIAGQEGSDEHDKLPAGGIGPETRAVLANLTK